MEKVKNVIAAVWFLGMGLLSPLWVGCTYMNITGHGKGYGYDLGSEADIAVGFGFILLVLWLLAVLPVAILLCRKCLAKKRALVWVPPLAFLAMFIIGVFVIGWGEFVKLFGYGYPV